MTVRSYSPHGLTEPNPDYDMCCGAYHATSAAKFFSLYFFMLCLLISGINFFSFGFDKFWFSIFCVLFTVYSVTILYGVFLEKKTFLLPFLVVQAILTIALFFAVLVFGLFGTFTNMISDHHRDSEPLRSIYKMHDLNPDDEKVQTVVASSVLFFAIFQLLIFAYSWFVMYKTYKCYKENDRTICPGYQKGIVATEDE